MNHGVMRKPPLANAAKPRATDSGVSEAVPSDIDRFGGSSASSKPKWLMYLRA